jgi:hypothetical protein
MNKLIQRRGEILSRLDETEPEEWGAVIARFAYDFGLTEKKVMEYFETLYRGKLLEQKTDGYDYDDLIVLIKNKG